MSGIPELKYKYSEIYDRILTRAIGKEFNRKEARDKYGSFLDELKGHWTKEKEKNVFRSISNCTGLEWKEETILVYFVNLLSVSGFSDPLTIRIDDRHLLICETLVHELTHHLFSQNHEEMKEIYSHLEEVYPGKSRRTRLHIVVCAVTRRVFTEVFGEEQYKEAFEVVSNYKGLKRPFQILEDIYPDLGDDILESLSKI